MLERLGMVVVFALAAAPWLAAQQDDADGRQVGPVLEHHLEGCHRRLGDQQHEPPQHTEADQGPASGPPTTEQHEGRHSE